MCRLRKKLKYNATNIHKKILKIEKYAKVVNKSQNMLLYTIFLFHKFQKTKFSKYV